MLDLWKKRLLAAFLLLSLLLGVAALLTLEAGVVCRAWKIEFGGQAESVGVLPQIDPQAIVSSPQGNSRGANNPRPPCE